MLEVDASVAAGEWDERTDWQQLATAACLSALAQTPFAGLASSGIPCEVAVRLANDEEVRQLNAHYRGKDRPTNVLSFPMMQPDLIEALVKSSEGEALLGDIILADGVVGREAAEKGVSISDHATHLIVHGLLHLLGYEHEDDTEAERMEAIERAALARLGIADPYAAGTG
jgi:probable rRNA maturation factor